MELTIDLLSAEPVRFTLVGARNGLPASAARSLPLALASPGLNMSPIRRSPFRI